MIYIDKQQNVADGEGYTRDYIEDSYDLGSHAFIPSLQSEEAFNRFRNQQYTPLSPHVDTNFKSLLLREQEGRCCYCMCRISDDAKDSNIEHLIPKKSPVGDLSYYAKYSDLLNHHVCHSATFEGKHYANKKVVAQQVRLPHMVAYENLVASCMDSHHCNSARGNAKMPPLPVIPDIESKVFYSRSGRVVSEDADVEFGNAIDLLKLNHEMLEQIRLLWRKVAESAYRVEQIIILTEAADKQAFLCEIFGKQSMTDLQPKWQNYAPIGENASTYYWDLFVRYDWFYDYYRHHDKDGNRI